MLRVPFCGSPETETFCQGKRARVFFPVGLWPHRAIYIYVYIYIYMVDHAEGGVELHIYIYIYIYVCMVRPPNDLAVVSGSLFNYFVCTNIYIYIYI